jgi:hypothetical protein
LFRGASLFGLFLFSDHDRLQTLLQGLWQLRAPLISAHKVTTSPFELRYFIFWQMVDGTTSNATNIGRTMMQLYINLQ